MFKIIFKKSEKNYKNQKRNKTKPNKEKLRVYFVDP